MMTSKSELKRLVVLSPFDIVEKYYALEEQISAKDAEIERHKAFVAADDMVKIMELNLQDGTATAEQVHDAYRKRYEARAKLEGN